VFLKLKFIFRGRYDQKYRVFRKNGKGTINFGSFTFASLVLGSIIKEEII